MTALLHVRDLRVVFPDPAGDVVAVRGTSFSLGRERLGLVGDSGAGKSQMARALLGLTPSPGRVTASRMSFDGIDLRAASPATWARLRGARLSMVVQDPASSFNPVMTIGRQIAEAAALHVGARHAPARALAMLEAVRLEAPERVMRAYPHELSGGMGQRAMIAMMLAREPELLIADEPTAALDTELGLRILHLLDELVRERGMALILISHDRGMVDAFCDRVLRVDAG